MGKHGRSSRKWRASRSVSLPHICKEALVLHSVSSPQNVTGVTWDFLTAGEPFKVHLIKRAPSYILVLVHFKMLYLANNFFKFEYAHSVWRHSISKVSCYHTSTLTTHRPSLTPCFLTSQDTLLKDRQSSLAPSHPIRILFICCIYFTLQMKL